MWQWTIHIRTERNVTTFYPCIVFAQLIDFFSVSERLGVKYNDDDANMTTQGHSRAWPKKRELIVFELCRVLLHCGVRTFFGLVRTGGGELFQTTLFELRGCNCTFAPLAARKLTMGVWPSAAARWRGVRRLREMRTDRSTSGHALMSMRRMFVLPTAAARCRAVIPIGQENNGEKITNKHHTPTHTHHTSPVVGKKFLRYGKHGVAMWGRMPLNPSTLLLRFLLLFKPLTGEIPYERIQLTKLWATNISCICFFCQKNLLWSHGNGKGSSSNWEKKYRDFQKWNFSSFYQRHASWTSFFF